MWEKMGEEGRRERIKERTVGERRGEEREKNTAEGRIEVKTEARRDNH